MTFERSTDYALLTALLRNAAIYPFLGDDFAPPIAEVAVVEHPEFRYVVARDGDQVLGFYLLAPQNAICWELHTAMPLNGRGLRAMRELLGPNGWLWSHTPCLRVVTNMPASNRIAARFGARAGMKVYGTNPRSFLLHGKLEDQILMGISKD